MILKTPPSRKKPRKKPPLVWHIYNPERLDLLAQWHESLPSSSLEIPSSDQTVQNLMTMYRRNKWEYIAPWEYRPPSKALAKGGGAGINEEKKEKLCGILSRRYEVVKHVQHILRVLRVERWVEFEQWEDGERGGELMVGVRRLVVEEKFGRWDGGARYLVECLAVAGVRIGVGDLEILVEEELDRR
ncbi:hypothetical protein BJ508DRAFT_325346 [Ascobolus immersus RN42]|uniref:Uncharacterized protein n=1 Tax=Ascobolus immersus RN42 TaxID=1160509 RepID=A0A3N4ILX5_ASCIM|nr:hypothetical protein BJ508DRAFT_325346 [Ascobolus immersus RN42]